MTKTRILPTIPLRGLVIFPSMILHFDVGRERSVNALKAAAKNNGEIFLVAQKDASETAPTQDDIYDVGVVGVVKQLLTTPDGSTRVLVEGLYRAKIVKFVSSGEYLKYEVKFEVRFASSQLLKSPILLDLAQTHDESCVPPLSESEYFEDLVQLKKDVRFESAPG